MFIRFVFSNRQPNAFQHSDQPVLKKVVPWIGVCDMVFSMFTVFILYGRFLTAANLKAEWVFCLMRRSQLFSVLSVISFLSKSGLVLRKNFKLRLFFHCLGLSGLGGAIFLQSLVFSGVVAHGIFMGVEHNIVMLYSELFLTVLAITYLGYLFWRFIISAI